MDRLDEPESDSGSGSSEIGSESDDGSSSAYEDFSSSSSGSWGMVGSVNWEGSSSSSSEDHDDEIRHRLENNDPTLTSLMHSDGACDCSSPSHGSHHYFFPNFSGDECWEKDGAIVGKNTCIEELQFRFDYSYDPNEDDFEKFFQGLSRNRSIQTLTFNCCDYGGIIFTTLTPFFKNNRNFRSLFLKHCDLYLDGDEANALVSALSSFDTLREFSMTGESVNKKARAKLIEALAGHSNLRALNLSENYLAEGGLLPLAAFLKNTKCRLAELDLTNNKMVDGDAILLADALVKNDTLTHLDLSGNSDITEAGWKHIADFLTNNTTRLESMSLNDNSMDDSSTISFFNTITHNSTKLKKLEFSENSSVTMAGWNALFAFLGSPNCVMEDLCLSRNGFMDEAFISLASSLSVNSTLRSLDLAINPGVTILGWRTLANALGNPNVILEKLDLRACMYRVDEICDSVTVFANSLTTNSNIRELVLFDISPHALAGWDALRHVLCNKSGIMDTFFSNHTLQKVCRETLDCTGNIPYLLNLNKNNNKFEVARQKIIDVHFTADINIQPFVDIELNVLPHAFAWLAKDFQVFSFLYRLVRSMPSLFEDAGGIMASNSPRSKKQKC